MSTTGFVLETRVYYEDSDAGGVVFYANYLKYMERARTEWLRALGFEQDELMQGYNVVFAVTQVQMDFIKPAKFNDLLSVSVVPMRLGKASFNVHQEIYRENELLNRADIKLACVDMKTFSPVRMPESVYKKAKSLVARYELTSLEK